MLVTLQHASSSVPSDRERPIHRRIAVHCLKIESVDVVISAPHIAELRTMESDLHVRTASAKTAMRAHEPPARVAPEHCSQCDVRHLCSDYWIPSARKAWVTENRSEFDDVELLILERLGESGWRCKCLVATHVPIGSTSEVCLGRE